MVAAGFIASFAVIGNLAWATALGTTGGWFSQAISLQTYSVAFLAGIVLAAFLVSFGANRAGALASELRSLNLGIAHVFTTDEPGGIVTKGGAPRGAPMPDASLRDIVASLPVSADAGWGPGGAYAHVLDLLDPGSETSVANRTLLLRQLLQERRVLRESVGQVWKVIAGPAAIALVFTGIAAIMLPGSGGFAETNFRLNTTLILFLMYGFSPLLAWTLVAVAWVHHAVVSAH
jgi:hypothetical protein